MTLTPSPLLVVSNASRAFSRGKRCVTKGLTLICLDASRAIATGHLQGKQRAGDESSHQSGAPRKEQGGAWFHYSNFVSPGNQGEFCLQSSGGGSSSIRQRRWGKPTALGCRAPGKQALLHTDSETVGCASPAGGQVSEKSQETTVLLKRRMKNKTAVRRSSLVQPPCLQTDHCGVQTHQLGAGRRKEKPQSASNLFSGRDLLNLIALPLHFNGPNWSDGDTQGCSS